MSAPDPAADYGALDDLTGPIDPDRIVLLCTNMQTASVCAEAMDTTAVAASNLLEAARALCPTKEPVKGE